MMAKLPPELPLEALDAFRRSHDRWLPVARDIARSSGLDASDLRPFSSGSNLIAAIGSARILKIFPPLLRHQFEAERRVLRHLDRRLSVPTPALEVEGERDGWPYLVMSRLAGVPGEQAWPQLDEPARERVLHAIGGLIAEVQRIPLGELSTLEPHWAPFLARQVAECRERHARLDFPPQLLEELDTFVAGALPLLPSHPQPVLLTGEYIPENFLLAEHGDGWRISGLIDFGDCMTGFGPYDLLGPSTFMACGRPNRVRALLEGFGYARAELNGDLSRMLMALLLLHRYSNLRAQVHVPGWETTPTLDALAQRLWPLEG